MPVLRVRCLGLAARDVQPGEREGEDRDHPCPDEGGADVGGDRAVVHRDADDRDDQREGSRSEQREAECASGAELAQPEDRRDPAYHRQEREEERSQGEAPGAQQAVEVEVHPGGDEVDRDQETEADALEPHPDGLGVGRVERQPDDQPCGEGAQDEVEADVVREQRQRRDDEDGEANRHLPGRLDGLLDDAHDRGRTGP